MTLKALEDAAMELPPRKRAKLATMLISSLDESGEKDVEALWLAEADRRFRAYQRGDSKGAPARQAIAAARNALKS